MGLADVMATLAEEMAVIRVIEDPAERRLLMEAHQNIMRKALILMRAMGGEAMQSTISDHLKDLEEISREKQRPVHRHRNIGGGSSAGIISSGLVNRELRLDMMRVVLESLQAQCAAQ